MIPVFEPSIGKEELQNVQDCIKSNWISSSGKYIELFEKDFAKFHKSKNAIALSNGTAALEVALHAIGIKKGDEVIIPSFTIISVAAAVIKLGAIPRFADVELGNWNIDPTYIKSLINKKTKAIIVVHSFGHPASMEEIIEISRNNNLLIVEDTAESLGSKYKDSLCGTFGDIATFSLYANKLITTGEGGMIITDNNNYALKARKYINLYFGDDERFSHSDLGFNYRMTNIQASIGCAQIKKINFFANEKIRIGNLYKSKLENSKNFTFQNSSNDIHHIFWMYALIINDSCKFSGYEFVQLLKKRGIDSRQLFKGLHLQEPLKKYLLKDQKPLKVTEHLYNKGFYLPSSINLTDGQIDYIISNIESIASWKK